MSPDYRYPYKALGGSGPAPAFPLQAEGSQRPMVEQGADSPAGTRFRSGAASSPHYERSVIVTSDSSSEPSRAPRYRWSPVASGKGTPGLSAEPQSVGDTSGTSGVGPVPPYAVYRDVPVPYDGAPSGFGEVGHPSSDAAAPSAAGAGPLRYWPVSGLPVWMPPNFPDVGAWESAGEEPQSVGETSPLPPSSYIIQSRNGYLRAREVLSHSKYSPDYYGPPPYPFEAAGGPSRSPAGPWTEGQKV